MLDSTGAWMLYEHERRERERQVRRRGLANQDAPGRAQRAGALRRMLGAGLLWLGGRLVGAGAETGAETGVC